MRLWGKLEHHLFSTLTRPPVNHSRWRQDYTIVSHGCSRARYFFEQGCGENGALTPNQSVLLGAVDERS